MSQPGKIMILIGAVFIIAGLVFHFAGGKLSWMGHLPGDIRVEKENIRFYFPVTTMILLSIVLSLILWILKKIL
jgi:hypothetical protein